MSEQLAHMNSADAEEFTQALGQIVSGSWRQVALAKRLGVPQALGLTLEDWVTTRLGGYVKLSIPDRREAAKELAAEGLSTREIGDVLGVDQSTVVRDANASSARKDDPVSSAKEDRRDANASPGAEPEPPQPPSPPEWSEDELSRKATAENGLCVVANLRGDAALIAWAHAADRFVRIDRATAWGNPFEMPDDGGRDHVVAMFGQFYLPHKPSLLGRLPTLRGKVLGCWCYPQDCHGRVIAEAVNAPIAGVDR
jgi:hypothetical protein